MYVPAGFGVVTPYIFARDASSYIRFLETAFGALETSRTEDPDGRVVHAQLRFDRTNIMLSEATEQFPNSTAAFYLFVADADASMERAIQAGAETIMDVGDMPYGDRQGGVRDPSGNIWWISQRLHAGSYD